MSTFCGLIEEIPGVTVDRFDGKNLNSEVFFLSHCHADHMNGLCSKYFQQKIVRENKFLYLSDVSAVILRALYPDISNQIRELPLEQVTCISIQDKHISVTCIPAGHCPGSVMFLFETDETRVLYTGDYRINSSDITKFSCFYDAFNNVKPVDKIYLDTTFFLKSYSILPKRADSLSELCKIILGWTSKDSENCIKLDARAKYGYEYVFKEVFDRCKMPVHVDDVKYQFYSLIPELDKCITTNGAATQIHSCRWGARDICELCNKEKLRIIKLSAFRWENADFEKGFTEVGGDGIFYVCYSTHASYEEGVALIDFLKPKDIHICVERPKDPVTTRIIQKLVKEKIDEINFKEEREIKKPKLFEIVEEPNSAESCGDDALGSPPKKLFKVSSILDSPPRIYLHKHSYP